MTNPAADVDKKKKVLLSLLPLLAVLAAFSTFYSFKWKKDYGRLAREKKGREIALSVLERARELVERVGKLTRLPSPDGVRLDDIQGLAEEAMDSATEAMSRAPTSEEATRVHGQALELMYNLEEARTSYEEAIKLHKESPARFHLGVLGTRQLARARLAGLKTSLLPPEKLEERAVEPLRRYQAPHVEFKVKIDQKNLTICTTCIAYSVGDHENALRSAGAAEGFDPTEWIVPYLRGLAHFELKNYAGAAKALEDTVRLAPAIADPHAWLGMAYSRLNRRADAIASLSTALEINQHFLEAYYARGTILFEDGRFADARRDFQACLQLRPSLPDGHLKLGIAAFEHWQRSGRTDPKDLDTAAASLTGYIDAQPRDVQGYILRARVSLARKDAAKAEADLAQALSLAPTAMDALFLRAEIHEAGGRWDAAIKDYELILEKGTDPPRVAQAQRSRARAKAAAGRLEEAVGDYDALIAKDPNDVSLLAEKAGLLLHAKKLDDALAATAKALAVSKGNARILVLRAEILLEKGDTPAAIQEASQAYAADPQHAESLVVRGRGYFKQDLKGKALADWKRALEIRPDLKDQLAPLIQQATTP